MLAESKERIRHVAKLCGDGWFPVSQQTAEEIETKIYELQQHMKTHLTQRK